MVVQTRASSWWALAAIAVVGNFVLGISSASAADVYWDTNGTTTGFGTASGTWGSSNFWNSDSTGGSGTFSTTMTTADIGNFGTSTDGLGAGTVNVSGTQSANGLAFGSASGHITLSGEPISLGGTTPTIMVNNASNTISSVLTGSAGIVKRGPGTVTFTANNTFTGGLTINAGTVGTGNSAALGSGTVFLGDITGSASAAISHTVGGDRTYSYNITVRSGSTGTKSITQPQTGSNTYTGSFTLDGNLAWALDAASVVVKNTGVVSGNGSMTFSGSSTGTIGFGGANTYTGGTTINPGVIIAVLQGPTGLAGNPTNGSFGSGTAPLVLNGGQMRSSISAGRGVGNVVTLAADTTFPTLGQEKTLTFTGPATLTGNRILTVNVGSTVGGTSVTFSGAIGDGGGGFGLTKAGAGNGTLLLSGSNTFSGPTAVIGGILSLGSSLALQNSPLDTATSVTGSTSAGLRTTVTTLTLGGLTGSGNMAASGGIFTTSTGGYGSVTTLTLNPGTGASLEYSGSITNGASGMNLVKSGAGIQTLSGTNTYTGATNVNAGTLSVIGGGSINSTSAINVAAGARFANNSSVALALAPTLSGNGVGSRAVYGGTGTLNAALTLNNVGDVLSPGNSPGIMSFSANQSWGSYSYDWELNDWAAKVAGTNIDQINITGGLTLTGATPGSYILNVLSLTGGDVTGNVPNFADANNSWTILTTTTGISGFSADYWTINAAGFTSSPTATGSWSVAQSGNDLVLNYVAVPEPAPIVLVASGAAILGSLLARRRRGS